MDFGGFLVHVMVSVFSFRRRSVFRVLIFGWSRVVRTMLSFCFSIRRRGCSVIVGGYLVFLVPVELERGLVCLEGDGGFFVWFGCFDGIVWVGGLIYVVDSGYIVYLVFQDPFDVGFQCLVRCWTGYVGFN